MAANLFLPFATGAGANVTSDAAWPTAATIAQGVQFGTADPAQANKAWRQGSVMASMLGQFIADWSAQDTNDSQAITTIEANFRTALAASLSGARYGIDSSGVPNSIVVTLTPPPPSPLNVFTVLWVKVANTNTGPTSLALNGQASKTVVRRDGSALAPGDLVQGRIYELIFEPTSQQFQVQRGSVEGSSAGSGAFIGIRVISTSGTYTPTNGVNRILAMCTGGGAGGGGGYNHTVGAGGGAGATAWAFISGPAAMAATIGAAGTAGLGLPSGSMNGSAGGTTSLGTLVSAGGGQPTSDATGDAYSRAGQGGAGGVASLGDLLITGGDGQCAVLDSQGTTSLMGGVGGASLWGGGGSVAPYVSGQYGRVGRDGQAWGSGGGGGGAQTGNYAYNGGAGKQGIIVILEFA